MSVQFSQLIKHKTRGARQSGAPAGGFHLDFDFCICASHLCHKLRYQRPELNVYCWRQLVVVTRMKFFFLSYAALDLDLHRLI